MEKKDKSFKATCNLTRNVTVNIKPAWYKKAVPTQMQQPDQLMINGLTQSEASAVKSEFVMKLIGLFTGSLVTSIKVEEEEAI